MSRGCLVQRLRFFRSFLFRQIHGLEFHTQVPTRHIGPSVRAFLFSVLLLFPLAALRGQQKKDTEKQPVVLRLIPIMLFGLVFQLVRRSVVWSDKQRIFWREFCLRLQPVWSFLRRQFLQLRRTFRGKNSFLTQRQFLIFFSYLRFFFLCRHPSALPLPAVH